MINVCTGTHVTASTAMNEAREETTVRIGIIGIPSGQDCSFHFVRENVLTRVNRVPRIITTAAVSFHNWLVRVRKNSNDFELVIGSTTIVERCYTGFYAAERDRNRAQYAQRRTRETRVSSIGSEFALRGTNRSDRV